MHNCAHVGCPVKIPLTSQYCYEHAPAYGYQPTHSENEEGGLLAPAAEIALDMVLNDEPNPTDVLPDVPSDDFGGFGGGESGGGGAGGDI